MPTPFYHLSIAKELLTPGKLPEAVYSRLLLQCQAFLLGSTAPDVQTISKQSRQETHFFKLPLESNPTLPWKALQKAYPTLAQSKQMNEAQTAFLAGYVCHIQADWLWVTKIFEPIFGERGNWGNNQYRQYIHNVLRAYMEQQVLHLLDSKISKLLTQAKPQHWMPFIRDTFLCQWRDFLAQQLAPGHKPKTVEVFAARQGISPRHFYKILDSEKRLKQDVFIHLPTLQLHCYRKALIKQNIEWLVQFLQPKNIDVPRTNYQVHPGALLETVYETD